MSVNTSNNGTATSPTNRPMPPAIRKLLDLPPKAKAIAWGALQEAENDPRVACTEILIYIGDRTNTPDEVMIEHVSRLLLIATGEAPEAAPAQR